MDIVAPEEIKSAQTQLEVIKNRITESEGEVLRLQKLAQAETYTVNEMVKAKAWNEQQIAELEAKKASLEEEIASLEKTLADAKEVVVNAKEVKASQDAAWADIESAKEDQAASLKSQNDEIANRSAIQDEREKEHAKRVQEVAQREAALNAKHNKIVAFASDLQEG